MSEQEELQTFLLSMKRTEVRFSLFAPFPWCLLEFENMNSQHPCAMQYAWDVESLAVSAAGRHGYTGVNRGTYIQEIIRAGNQSYDQWFPKEPEALPVPPYNPLPLIADELLGKDADGKLFWIRSQPDRQPRFVRYVIFILCGAFVGSLIALALSQLL